ncbi:autotransporter-associated beta strand repeat-containing protein [Planctomycetota bacterium]|nr:autotransporter-associated beta strand repeat-containing protein [Planctomycetota bacterium]
MINGMITISRIGMSLGAVGLLLSSSTIGADVTFFDTQNNNSWQDSANWINSTAPTADVDGSIFVQSGFDTGGDPAMPITGIDNDYHNIDTLRFIIAGVDNTYDLQGTGSLTFNSGGIIYNYKSATNNVSVDKIIGSAGTLTFHTASGALGIGSDVDLSAGTELIVTGSYDTEITGIISGAGGSLTKQASNTLILTGDNTYAGGTTILAGTLQIGNGGTTGSVQGDIVNHGTLAFKHSANSLTYDGNISGVGELVLNSGASRLILTGANTYTGGTTLNYGILQIGDGGTTGSIGGDIVNYSFLQFRRSDDYTYAGVISGSGQLVHSGTGNTTLAGGTVDTPSVLGSVLLERGTLTVSGAVEVSGITTQWGFNTLNIDGGTLKIDQLTGGGTTSIADGNTLTVGFNGGSSTYGGLIQDDGSLIKEGSGTFILTGTNTFTGGTTLSDGTLQIGNYDPIDGSGGTTGSIQGDIANSGTIAFNRSDDLTYADVISGTGALTKEGAGTLTLTGTNIFTGGTTLSGGTLQIGDGGTTGSIQGDIVNSGTLAFNRSDDITYADVISGTGALVKNGSGTLTLSGTNTYTGDTTISDGIVDISGNSSAFGGTDASGNYGTVIFEGDATILNTSDFPTIWNDIHINGYTTTIEPTFGFIYLEGDISGTGTLVLDALVGTGNKKSIELHGDNSSFTGNVEASGILKVFNNDVFGTGTLATKGYLDIKVSSEATLNNHFVLEYYDGVDFYVNNNLTLNGDISGSHWSDAYILDIRNDSGGDVTLTLNGDNTYTADTRINDAGIKVVVGTDSAFGGADSNNNYGVVTVNSVADLSAGASSISLANAFTLNDDLVISGDNDLTLDDVIDGTGALIKEGSGTLTLNGVNTYSGGTTLSAGGITVGNDDAISTGSLTVDGASELSAGASSVTLANAVTLSDTLTISGDNDLTLTNVISDGTSSGALAKTGAGTLVLSGTNTYTGGTTISAGTLQIGDGGTTGSIQGDIVNNGTLAFNRSDDITYADVISGTGGLVKNGSNKLTLSGINTYTGDTTISDGTIYIDNTNAAFGGADGNGDYGIVTFTGDATIEIGPVGIDVHNDIDLDSHEVTIERLSSDISGDLILKGDISGDEDSHLVLDADLDGYLRIISLEGDNSSFAGDITASGDLYVHNDNALGDATLTNMPGKYLSLVAGSSVVLDNDMTVTKHGGYDLLILWLKNDMTLNGVISGTGRLWTGPSTSGTLTLNGANTYEGGTTLRSGSIVVVGNDSAFGTGSVTLNSAADLSAGFNANTGLSSFTLANAFTLNDDLTISGDNDLTLTDVISGTGALIKTGAGTLTLNGVNTYSGGTTLSAGGITVGNDNAISTGSLTVDGASELSAGASSVTLANAIALSDTLTVSGDNDLTLSNVISDGTSSGALTKTGAGTLVLSGTNTYTGGTTISAGTLQIGDGGTTGSIQGDVLNNGTLAFNRSDDITYAGVISGTGGLVKNGSNTLTLSGINTYTGDTTISGGAIYIDRTDQAFGGTDGNGEYGTVIFEGDTSVDASDGINIHNDIDLGSYGVTFTNHTGSNSLFFEGDISGDANSLLVLDANLGTVLYDMAIHGDNSSFAGDIAASGIIKVYNDDALGTGTFKNMSGKYLTLTAASSVVLNNNMEVTYYSKAHSLLKLRVGHDMTLNGVISGTGRLGTDPGYSGTLTLNGANTYEGGTALYAGNIVVVGNDSAFGTGLVAVDGTTDLSAGISSITLANAFTLNDDLTISGDNDLTLDDVIDGTGALIKTGSGTLTLNGVNTYSGGTTLSAGGITVGNDDAISTGSLTVDGASELSAGASSVTLANAVTLSDTLTISGDNDLTLTNVISDGTSSGALAKTGAGTLVLSGTNTYSGGTTISGGTLQIGDGGTTGSIQGDVLNNGTLAFNRSDDLTYADVISGTGSLVKNGSNTLTLSGINTYTGDTTISGGTIYIDNTNAAFGGTDVNGDYGTMTFTGNATIDSSTDGISVHNDINLGSHEVTFENLTGGLPLGLHGDISGEDDSHLVLDAYNEITGNLNVIILRGDNSSFAGDITASGNLYVYNDNALGTGTLRNMSDKDLTLASGSSVVLENNMEVTDHHPFYDLLQLRVQSDMTLNGVISGTGRLATHPSSSGTLTLNGANTYEGGTTLYAGNIVVGNDSAFSTGSVTVNGTTDLSAGASSISLANAFTLNDDLTISGDTGHDLALTGVIDGSGVLTKEGAGTLVLSGTNIYSGGTTISAGTLQIGNGGTTGSILGDVLNNGTLAFNRSNDLTYADVISGTGSLVKNGSGTLTLSGTNIFTGPTTISGGTLAVNNALGGAVTVNGGTLAGTGTLSDAVTVASGGTIAPGNSIGTLYTGDLAVAGTVEIEIDAAGASDTIDVTGTVDITDATLDLQSFGSIGSLAILTAHTIIENDGVDAVTGTFASGTDLNTQSDFFSAVNTVGGDGNDVTLDVYRTSITLADGDDNSENVTFPTNFGDFTFTVAGSDSATFSGSFSQTSTPVGVIKDGTGTLAMTGTNTYTGGTTLSAGGIAVGNDNAIGTGSLTVDGASELSAGTSSVTLGNAVTLNDDLTISGDNDLTLSNVISGTGALAKTGSGTLTLSGTNTYTGNTTISGGTVYIDGTNQAFGGTDGNGDYGTVTFTGDATIDTSMVNIDVYNDIDLGSHDVTVKRLGSSVSGTLQLNGDISGDEDSLLVLDADLAGSLRIISLFGDNSSFAGDITASGHIWVYNDDALGTGTLTNMSGKYLTLISGSSVVLDNNMVVTDYGGPYNLLQLDVGNDMTLNGVISGTGRLGTRPGASGTLTLNGANTYQGGTELNAGSIVVVGNDSAFGTGSVTLNSAADLSAGLSSISLANAFTLNDDLTISGDNDLTLTDVISGTGALIKEGAGTLTLSGTNTYTGDTTLSGGAVIAGSDSAFGDSAGVISVTANTSLESDHDDRTLSNDFTIGLNSILTVSGAYDLLLTGDIDGEGGLTKEGDSTLTLSGHNTYTGATLVSGGILQVMNDDALGDGTLTILGSAELIVADIVTDLDNDIAIDPGQTFTVGELGDMTLSGVISGDGELLKVGSGTLTLSGTNTYTGDTTISDGIIDITGNSSAFGGADGNGDYGTITFTGDATIQTDDPNKSDQIYINNNININSHAVTVENKGHTIELYGDIIGNDEALLVLDARYSTVSAIIKLHGDNSGFAGDVNAEGQMYVYSDNAFGTGTLTTTSYVAVHSRENTGAILDNNFAIDYGGGLHFYQNNDMTLNGVISSFGPLIINGGGGTLTLNGANTYTGDTTMNDGSIVVIGSDSAFGTESITLNGAVSLLSGVDDEDGVWVANAFTMSEDSTLTVDGDLDLTLNANIFDDGDVISEFGNITTNVGNGRLIKKGGGTLYLNGFNLYSGGTEIHGGTVVLLGGRDSGQMGNRLGFGTVELMGDAEIRSGEKQSSEVVNIYNDIDLDSYTLTTSTDETILRFYGSISGDGGSIVHNGPLRLVLDADNTFTGGVTMNGGTLYVYTDTGLGTGVLTINSASRMSSYFKNLTLDNDIVLNADLELDYYSSYMNLTGVISGDGALTQDSSNDVTLTLSGDNSYTGGTTFDTGILQVSHDNALGTGTLTVDTTPISGLPTDPPATASLRAGVDGVAIANDIVLETELQVIGSNDLTLGGDISGVSGLNKTDGDHTLTLTGTNTYSGGTNIDAGAIIAEGGNAIGDSSLVVIADVAGAMLQLNANETIGGLTGGGSTGGEVNLQDNTLTIGGDDDTTFDGVISGTGSLAITGTGTLALGGANTFTGGTTLNGGVTTVNSDDAFGTGSVTVAGASGLTAGLSSVTLANTFTLNDTLTVSGDNDLTFDGNISGTSGLVKEGDGTLVLNGYNTYSGDTTIAGGTIELLGVNSSGINYHRLGTGTVIFTGDAGIQGGTNPSNWANVWIDNDINLNDHVMTTTTVECDLNFSGDISGDGGSIVHDGPGKLYLGGSNTFTGGVTVNSGVLAIRDDNALGSGVLTIAGESELEFEVDYLTFDNDVVLNADLMMDPNKGSTVNGVISGTGALTIDETASDYVLILNGNNTYSGGTTLNVGVIQVGSHNALGTGALTVAESIHPAFTTSLSAGSSGITIDNDVTLNGDLIAIGSNDLTLDGVISGTSGLIKEDSGTLTLSGTNTYSGGTNINAGTIIASGGNAIGDTGIVTIADVAGAMLQLNADETIGGLTGGGSTGGEVNLQDNTLTIGGDTIFDGVISGTGSLAITGTGTLTLGGANTFTGGTTLNGGVTTVNSDDAFGTGSVTVAGASGLTAGISSVTLANTFTLNDTLTVSGDNDLALDGVLSGLGGLEIDTDGTLTLNGVNTYEGGTTFQSGGVVIGHSSALGTGDVDVTGDFELSVSTDDINMTNNFTIADGITLDLFGEFDFEISGNIVGDGDLTVSPNIFVTLSGNNTFAGNTTLDGVTVMLSSDTAFSSGDVQVVGDSILQSSADERMIANDISIDDQITLTFEGDNDLTLDGVISGDGGFTKNGDSTLTLTNDNTYSGGTTLSSGGITIGSDDAIGSGTLTVSGVSELSAGISSVTLGNAVTLNDDLTITGDNDLTLDGVISGTSGLVKNDSGTLTLNGVNIYSGDTTIAGGTIVLKGVPDSGLNYNRLGTGTVNFTGDATLQSGETVGPVHHYGPQIDNDIDLGNSVMTIEGSIDFRGTITDDGSGGGGGITINSGSVYLGSNTHSFSGGITLNGATLVSATTGALGTGTITINDTSYFYSSGTETFDNDMVLNANWVVNTGIDTTFNGVISGEGALVRETGTNNDVLVLNGDNTYSGGTTLSIGTLTVGHDNAFGSGTLTVVSNIAPKILQAGSDGITIDNAITLSGDLTVTGDNDLTLDGTIGSTGALTKEGSGTLTLSGDNTFAGGFTLADGDVVLGHDDALGEGSVSVTGNANLQSSADERTVGNNISIDDQIALTVSGDNDLALDGVLSGLGGLEIDTDGTLTLNGVNTYEGGTTFQSGGVVIGHSSALGTGDVDVTGDFELSVSTDDINMTNNFTIADGITLDLFGEFDFEISGNIVGDGDLTVSPNIFVTLSGNNTFAGNTTLDGVTVMLSSDTAFSSGDVQVVGDSILQSSADERMIANDISIDDQITLTFEGDNDLTLDGVISGDGGFTKNGDSTLTLTNDNTYSGGTTLSSGGITIGSDDAIGSGTLTVSGVSELSAGISSVTLGNAVTLNDDLTITGDNDLTLDGVISGTSGLIKEGVGTLTLSGTNTYSGGTTLSAGGIAVSSDNAIGDGLLTVSGVSELSTGISSVTLGNAVTLNNDLTITGDNDLTLDGVISGTSGLTKEGISTLTLTGQNTYSGGTDINEGTVVASGGNAIIDSGTVTLADVDGATLLLDADETIGSLVGGGSTGGEVSLQSNTLTVGDENDATYAGVISGTGDFIKEGSGTLVLSHNDNTYTGDTTVNEGILIVNGNMASANINVANGAMLSGAMSLAGNYNNSGRMSPGNSPGTMAIGGNLTLTGTSVYDMEIESTAGAGVGNDLIDVDGTADVDGTLNVIGLPGYTPTDGDTFTILESDGGVSGTFSSIFENLGSFNVKAIYNANDIMIELIGVSFTEVVTDPRLASAAAAFAQIADSNPTGDIATVISQLQTLTDAQLVAAFDQLVPHYLVPQAQATFKGIDVQNNNFNGRLNELRYGLPQLWSNNLQVQTPQASTAEESADPEVAIGLAMQTQQTLEQQQETNRFSGTGKDVWGAWVNGFGTFGDFDSQESQAGFEFNTGGVTLGFDYRVLDTLAAGAFLGYSNTGITVDNGLGTSSFNSINTGMYMTWFNEDGFYASGLFGGGVNFYENNRRIRFGAIDRVAESDPTGFYLQTLATGGYEFKKGNWGIGPQLALQWVNLQIGSHSETGAEDLNLDVGAFNGNSFVTRLGFRATYEYDTSEMLFVPELVGSWEHEYLDPIDTVNVGMPAGGESFSYTGIGTGRDSGLIGVNLIGISHKAPISFTVQYNTEFTPDDFIVSNIYAGVRISF